MKKDAIQKLGNEQTAVAAENEIPNTVKNQNLGHNSKKTGLGPNTKR